MCVHVHRHTPHTHTEHYKNVNWIPSKITRGVISREGGGITGLSRAYWKLVPAKRYFSKNRSGANMKNIHESYSFE